VAFPFQLILIEHDLDVDLRSVSPFLLVFFLPWVAYRELNRLRYPYISISRFRRSLPPFPDRLDAEQVLARSSSRIRIYL